MSLQFGSGALGGIGDMDSEGNTRRRFNIRPNSANSQISISTKTANSGHDSMDSVSPAANTPPSYGTGANGDHRESAVDTSPSLQQNAPFSPNSDAKLSNQIATSGTNAGKAPRRWEQWNSSEINAFFEGVKQFGKDFDQMAKLMARRKLNKDKDQIRNYYFNSLKLLRSTARIDENLIADVPRDVRELFIVINGFEWKRKVCGKFDASKFRQLIMDGSATVKIKKKKGVVLIRTPICPALQKFFPSCKSSTPLPSHVVISLMPKTEADRCFVEQCGQNPLLKIRIAIGDQISRIFTLLKVKWNMRTRKMDDEISKEKEQMKLVLYPDKTTRVGKLVVNLYEATPMIFSLNRLKKEQIQRTGATEESAEQPKDLDAVVDEDVDGEMEKSGPLEEDGPFTINQHKLRAGLTEDNVHQATVIELYYLCGKETEIRLLYSTGVSRIGDPEAWQIFVSLLDRGYGDSLCKYLADPHKMAELDSLAKPVPEDRSRKRRISVSNDIPQQSDDVTSSVSSKTVGAIQTCRNDMVEAENSAFMEQLESLKVKKRARSFHQRNPGKNSNIMQTISTYSTSRHHLMATTSNHQMAGHLFMKHNEQQSLAVATVPATHFILPTNDAARTDIGAGDVQLHSGIDGMRSNICDPVPETNVVDKSIALTELSTMGLSGNSNMLFSPARETSLPDDVRSSIEMMQQQNSVDYCRNFEELVTTFEAAPTAINCATELDNIMHLMSPQFVPTTPGGLKSRNSNNGNKYAYKTSGKSHDL